MLGYIQHTSWPRCRFPAFICTREHSQPYHPPTRRLVRRTWWHTVAYGGIWWHAPNEHMQQNLEHHPPRANSSGRRMYDMMAPSYHEARTTRGLGLAYPAIVRRRRLFSPRVYLAELSNRPPNCWIGCVSVRPLCDEHANDVLSRLLLHYTVSYVHTWYTYIACSPPV